jgi:LuxR family maltose regulon positive regulatory protein
LLSYLEKSAKTAGRVDTLIEILALKATALHAQKRPEEALHTLEECLLLAEPGGYVRVFLDAGNPMRDLLISYLRTPELPLKPYAQMLLNAVHADGTVSFPDALPARSPSPAGFIEPLTPREMEVLRLMTEGCSNQQIAATLVLSEGTIKFHVHSILAKIQVHSRTQAIAAAKKLNLI